MPATQPHRISIVDSDTETGTCAVCGPDTRLRWRAHRSQWACRFADKRTRRPYKSSPEALRRQRLKKFGLTESQYDEMLAAQGGTCAICHGACPTGWRLAVDHDHETGQVRGLLCLRCNSALGLFHEQPERLRSALAYLSADRTA
jgi:hypothetical protein